MKRIYLLLSFVIVGVVACRKEENTLVVSGANTDKAVVVAKRFLFDATKSETAGNADWVIDQDNSIPQQIPTPFQSTITFTTPETFWTGAISSWGIALAKEGHTVETLPKGKAITFGKATNPQDLSKYDVFIVDEPNNQFTATEKTAILNFVKNGGGLFMISDHTISDRDNDGWDSPAIWNDLMNKNRVQKNPFGFQIDLTNISETSTNVTTTINPITNGLEGNISMLKFFNGATVTTTAGSVAKGLIWRTGAAQSATQIMAAYSTFGTGRVFVITDSSPADDGTGAPGNNLFFGWTDANGDHAKLHMNASLWLAKLQ